MTAIAIGKTKTGTFGVIDAMVQKQLTIKSFKDCRLQDKITELESSNQFMLLCGEEIIAMGASFIESWCRMNKLKLDLFKEVNFKSLLISCDRYRQYCIDVQSEKLIPQESNSVYILDNKNIRRYTVKHNDKKYFIVSTYDFKEGEKVIDYKGNISNIQFDEEEVIKSAILKIEEEHNYRKKEGYKEHKTPLKYDFEGRFSAVLFENDGLKERLYPYRAMTEQYLSWGNDWDYIESKKFKFSPIIP